MPEPGRALTREQVEERLRLGCHRCEDLARSHELLREDLKEMYLRYVISTDPIPPADIERARQFVREQRWVKDAVLAAGEEAP